MSSLPPVSLQISLAPGDFPHARHLLPHQLRQWAGQVREVLLTVDTRPGRGRFAAAWAENRPLLDQFLIDIRSRWPSIKVVNVDYSAQVAREIGEQFFAGQAPPGKDFRGGPFYSYFFGLFTASQEYVMHIDSDMLFGGGSTSWTAEACHLLDGRPDVFTCSPLPGPPSANGSLGTQNAPREPLGSIAFRFPGMSTRLFFVRRTAIPELLGGIPLARPSWRNCVKAIVEGNPPFDLPENLVSQSMARRGLCRIDFLGASPGMWSLHPPYRSEVFYRELPHIVERVEAGDLPDAQGGDFDLNDSVIDWQDARDRLRGQRWWRRLLRRIAG